jgi:hypothetical protein
VFVAIHSGEKDISNRKFAAPESILTVINRGVNHSSNHIWGGTYHVRKVAQQPADREAWIDDYLVAYILQDRNKNQQNVLRENRKPLIIRSESVAQGRAAHLLRAGSQRSFRNR